MSQIFYLDLIEYINRAPTGDNCQPFTYEYSICSQTIKVRHEIKRAAHYLNPKSLMSYIFLGGVVELFDHFCKVHSCDYSWELNTPDFQKLHSTPTCLIATFRLQNTPQNYDSVKQAALLNQICEIKTIRAPYEKSLRVPYIFSNSGPVRSGPISSFEVQSLSDNTKNVFSICVDKLWAIPEVVSDAMKWIHPTLKSYLNSGDGFHWSEVGMQAPESLSLPFARTQFGSRMIATTLLRKLISHREINQFRNSGAYILAAGLLQNTSDLIDLGRWFVKTRMHCHERDICIQPLSAFGLCNRLARTFHVPDLFNAAFSDQILNCLKEDFQLPDETQPIWFFRAGHHAPLALKTQRRAIDKIAAHIEGA